MTPTANSKLRPERSLNTAEVTEWNRKLKWGSSHSRKENGDVRRNQKAHVLHSKAPVLGASLFRSPSTCSGQQLNSPSQLPRTTGERYLFIVLPHMAFRNTASSCSATCPAGKGQLQESMRCKYIQGRPCSKLFCSIAPVLILAASLPPPPKRVFHTRTEEISKEKC